MHSTLQLTVIGKVFNPNAGKILALNRDLDQYVACVTWYLSFKSTSKTQLHKQAYQQAKEKFTLKTALLQSARDKAVEIYKSFQQVKGDNSKIRLKQCCMRFDERSFAFVKAITKLTPYWLHLSLSGKRGRTAVPLVFGERKVLIEQALAGHYSIKNVELKKRAGGWYAHLTLSRSVELPDTPATVIGLDRGEKNFAVAVSLHQDNPAQPRQGIFWSGAAIKALQGKYHHIRRNLGRKKLPQMIKNITGKLARTTDHLLHQLANEIVAYANQFEKPMIVMEDLTQLSQHSSTDNEFVGMGDSWMPRTTG